MQVDGRGRSELLGERHVDVDREDDDGDEGKDDLSGHRDLKIIG
jgi:hypothetical protein